MRGVRISVQDLAAVRATMDELRAERLIAGAAEDVRLEMHVALWTHPDDVPVDIKRSIARLAALAYIREQRHLAPTAPVVPESPPSPPRKPRASWWGSLFTELED